MTAQEMLDLAIIELGNLKNGDIFIVKDLFKGHVWSKQDRAERLLLGTLFLNHARQKNDEIAVLEKNSSGQQEYRMLDGWRYKDGSPTSCFVKTGVISLKRMDKDVVVASIGTSGLDLCEMCIRTPAEVERLSNVINQSINAWKDGNEPFNDNAE